VGRIGTDDLVLRSLEREGVDVSGVSRDDGETGTALVLVDAGGENVIVVAPAANRRLTAADVDVGNADAVMCQMEIPIEAIDAAARQAPFFCLNAAPARGPLPLGLRPDLLIVNRYEREIVGPYGGLMALTFGADGAVLSEDGVEVARARPPQVTAVDGTAAGDAFCAALVVSLLEERSRELALARACAAGALAASRSGAQPSLPTAQDVDRVLRI
jgi:ribokinase